MRVNKRYGNRKVTRCNGTISWRDDCAAMGCSLPSYGRADDWCYYEPTKSIITSVNVAQNAIEAIRLDPSWKGGKYGEEQPMKGLQLANRMMFMNAFDEHFMKQPTLVIV